MVGQRSVIFPAHSQVQSETIVDFDIILEEPGCVSLAISVYDSIRSTLHAKKADDKRPEGRVGSRARCAETAATEEHIVSTIADQEPAQQRLEGKIPLQRLIFEPGPYRVLAMRPGNLVRELYLSRRAIE